jgi:glutathione S-transferase
MKLYMFPVAPNPTRVRLFLAEKAAAGAEIPIEQIPINLREGEHRTPEHLARNPFGKIPVLELDDGTCFGESLAIIEYLEELHPDPPLIGIDSRERLAVRTLERVAEMGVLHPVARAIHASNSPLGLPPNPEVAKFHLEMLPTGLGYLNDTLADGRPFVAGDRPTIADCTLAAALQFARFRELEIDPSFQHVHAWDTRYREREPAKATLLL